MTADYFTKPLQGELFHQLTDHIMGIDPHDKYHSGHRASNEQTDTNQTQTDEQADVP